MLANDIFILGNNRQEIIHSTEKLTVSMKDMGL